jgi:hypothetical protein
LPTALHVARPRLLAAVAFVASGWLLWSYKIPTGSLFSAFGDVPIVMHTAGGRLEVAIITTSESFQLNAPAKSVLGIDLGSTVSHIRVQAVYRHHIEMAKEWPVHFNGSSAVVEANERQLANHLSICGGLKV